MSTDEDWQAALESALTAWPGLATSREPLATHARALRADGDAHPEHLADLHLAFAAASGDAAALRLFDQRVLAHIDPAVRRIDAAPDFVDEIRQALRVRLLVSEGDRPPRLADYRARGPLVGWVRVAAVRLALNAKRGGRPAAAADETLAELASDPAPEFEHVRRLYRAEFNEALRDAVAALGERQRVVLRLHFVDGLTLARIGALYGVHESTVSRWVSKAADAVASGAQARLRERLSLSADTFDSIARVIQGDLHLSISRLLRV